MKMKDPNDNETIDFFDDAQTKKGRPRKYANAAEKQRAYRARLKARGLVERRRIVPAPVPADEPIRSSVLDVSGDLAAALLSRKRR